MQRDPVIERADIVYDGGPGLTPTVIKTRGSELLACWATRGDGMPGQSMQFARSLNCGESWSAPFLTLTPDQPLTGLYTTLHSLTAEGATRSRVLRYSLEVIWPSEPDPSKPDYLSLAGRRKFRSRYALSEDGAQTFSGEKSLDDPANPNAFAQGNIVRLPNGDLLWPWGHWQAQPLNGFRRSTDNGSTWGPIVRAWEDPPPGHDRPLRFNETAAAVCPDGTILAVARVDSLRDKLFWQITSDDNGVSWSAPRQIEIAGGSPALFCTPGGQLWLAYRDAGVGPGLGLAVSDNVGKTWRFLYHLKEPKGEHERLYGHIRFTDEHRKQQWRPAEGVVGYPCFVQLSETEVYIVYHAQNRTELPKRYPPGAQPYYIAGNLLRIPR